MAGRRRPLNIFVLLGLFFREHRLKFSRAIKYGSIVVVISAYFSVLVSIPSISEFAEVGPYEVAKFDTYISGPVGKADIETIESKAETVVAGARFGGVEVYVNERFAGCVNLTLVDDLEEALRISETNERYIRRGNVSEKGAVVDEHTAKKLGVGLGDRIKIEIREGVSARYKIVAILYPTSVTKGAILADYPQKVKDAFRPYEYTSFWVKWRNGVPSELIGRVNYGFVQRSDAIQEQKKAMDELTRNWWFRLLKWGSIFALLLITTRDLLLLFDTRRKEYALLLGLGFKRGSLVASFSAENLLRITIAVFVGILCARFFILTVVGFYYPPKAFMDSLFYLLLAVITASFLGGVAASIRLRRISIAEVLAEG